MTQYMQSCIALYDLKVEWHYFKNEQDHQKERAKYKNYFYERKLEDGLVIKIRADGYYVFDFSQSTFGLSAEYKNEDNCTGNNFYINNKRIEVMHAFLACLRYSIQKYTKFHQGLHAISLLLKYIRVN